MRHIGTRLHSALLPLIVWWWQEMRDTAESLALKIAPRLATQTLFHLDARAMTVWGLRGKTRYPLLSIPGHFATVSRADLSGLGGELSLHGTRAVLALAPEFILRHRLELPASVESDLDAVVGLQLERDLPLRRERFCIDRGLIERSRVNGRMQVELLIARREDVERACEVARAFGLKPWRIGALDEADETRGNFLASQARFQRFTFTGADRILARAAVALALSWLAVIAGQWLYERVAVSRELKRVTAISLRAERLSRELAAQATPAATLARLTQEPDALDALASLTEAVPADSWAYQFEVTADSTATSSIKLSGFTPAATILADQLQKSGLFDKVQLLSAISAGLGSGQDRVQLSGNVRSERGEGAPNDAR